MFEPNITIRGQTTLVRSVRDSLAVKAGDKVRYVILDEGALTMPLRPTSRLFGILKYDGSTVILHEMENAIDERTVRTAPVFQQYIVPAFRSLDIRHRFQLLALVRH